MASVSNALNDPVTTKDKDNIGKDKRDNRTDLVIDEPESTGSPSSLSTNTVTTFSHLPDLAEIMLIKGEDPAELEVLKSLKSMEQGNNF